MTQDWSSRFLALSRQLEYFSTLWRASAFYSLNLAWREHWPQLNQTLLNLSETELNDLERQPERLNQLLQSQLPGYDAMLALIEIPACHQHVNLAKRLNTDVPGRKWSQISAFIGSLDQHKPAAAHNVLDWCSGKAYLGRALAHHWHCSLHAVEQQATLCEQGQALAARWIDHAEFHCKDVLAEAHPMSSDQAVVALHACGDLHRTLIRQWRDSPSPWLALSPCCYHLWLTDNYQPLSTLGEQNNLQLTKNQVHLAVQETVTASAKVRQQANLLALWRMAFDLIQRELRDVDSYLPTPSLPHALIKQGPETVIRLLATQKGLAIPGDFDITRYLQQAELRYAQHRRLQLASHGFRRALEVWLVLDLMLYLQEANCSVDLVSFCERGITPRNLRILATR